MKEMTPKEVVARIIKERRIDKTKAYESAIMNKKMKAAREIEDKKILSSAISEGLL